MILEVNICEVYSVCGCLCSIPCCGDDLYESSVPPTDARCLLCIHHHVACSQSSRTVIHRDLAPSRTDNQTGWQAKRVGVLLSPRGGVTFCVWACDKVLAHKRLCVSWLYKVSRGQLLPFLHFTKFNLRPRSLPLLLLLGILFPLFCVFSPQPPSSLSLEYSPGSR